ncbi:MULTISPECIES: HIT family protein [Methylobacterium]|uniref:HIT family protein n=1 Tax=Methylobacterium TaxID=407 RepID=UPI001048E1B6|nr:MULTISPECIES: HIT domain-containing protein [Methylobacterium]MDR7039109.1 histidine triad (HIT) family protein [Methylobacterium sp. BE186]
MTTDSPAPRAPYDPDNIFARILRGEIPAHKVYEDEATLAFMDVMPQGEGHTLVIPKAPARGLLDADPASLAALAASVQRVARAVKAAFAADGLTIFQYNEPAGGQTVFHLHVHIVPRREGVPLKRHEGGMADPDLLAEHAERIRAALKAGEG